MPGEIHSIVIFGGARGIGAAVARRFAAAGYVVVIGDVLEAEGRALEGEYEGGNVRFTRCDVANPEEIDGVFDFALGAAGGIDVVFNNVGIARYGEVDVLSIDDWEHTLRVNLTAQFLSCKRAVKAMKIDTPLVQISAETFEDRDPADLRREWAAHHPLNRLGTPEEVAELYG